PLRGPARRADVRRRLPNPRDRRQLPRKRSREAVDRASEGRAREQRLTGPALDAPPPEPPPRPRGYRRFVAHPLFHAALAACTFLSTTVAGALMAAGNLTAPALREGLWFSIPVMTILGTHEMGHYLMCRRYGLAATLPYFLPSPLAFGTFGAIIRIKEP